MEQTITVPEGKNQLTVTTSNARSIEILSNSGSVIGGITSENITAPQIFYLEPGEYRVITDGHLDSLITSAEVPIKSEAEPSPIEQAQLVLISDAEDVHVVDGIGEISADGQSFTKITIQKCTPEGNPLQRPEDDDEIFLRTTAGFIKDDWGAQEIRSVRLSHGEAVFRLYSEPHKRVATIDALSASPNLNHVSIRIEFF